jgi:HSP20 family protein
LRARLSRVARQKNGRKDIMTAKEIDVAPAKAPLPAHEEPAYLGPFRTLERFADEVERIFDDFGLGRAWGRSQAAGKPVTWAPRVDVTQHHGELVIRVDLPGLEKDDVKVNVSDDAVRVQGERHRAQEEERDGVYRFERSHGTFYRTIPLPVGTVTDQAKASLKDGVLEIRMPAAPDVKGRPVEITG